MKRKIRRNIRKQTASGKDASFSKKKPLEDKKRRPAVSRVPLGFNWLG